jgi:large subunit ribosomal protein L25
MDTTLDATVRDASRGKSNARKVRRAGKLPAVIYGRDAQATSVEVDPHVLDTIFRKTQDRNTVVTVKLEDHVLPCLVRTVQRHPVTRQIVHVDFYKLEAGQEVTVKVPLDPQGRPAGTALGGRLRVLVREVPIRCSWEHIPAKLTIDVTPMEVGDFIRLSELPTPEGVALAYEHDANALTVYGKRTDSLGLPEEEAEAAAAAAAAEAEAGAAEEGEDE